MPYTTSLAADKERSPYLLSSPADMVIFTRPDNRLKKEIRELKDDSII